MKWSSSQDKYTKDCLSVDEEYDVERIIKNQLLELRLVSLIEIQLRRHMGSYEEKDFIRLWHSSIFFNEMQRIAI